MMVEVVTVSQDVVTVVAHPQFNNSTGVVVVLVVVVTVPDRPPV